MKKLLIAVGLALLILALLLVSCSDPTGPDLGGIYLELEDGRLVPCAYVESTDPDGTRVISMDCDFDHPINPEDL